MKISNQPWFNTLSKSIERFYFSPYFIMLVTVIGVVGFVFQHEFIAVFLFVAMIGVLFMFVKNILPFFLLMTMIGMVVLEPRTVEVSKYNPLYFALPLFIIPLILRFFIFPFKLRRGPFFYPTVAVAIAVTIGGLFSISVGAYFAPKSIYYVIGLGLFMVLFYLFVEAYLPDDDPLMADYFAKMMIGIGIMGIMMYGLRIALNPELIDNTFPRKIYHWRNNLSNNLLLSMPFAFYLAVKKRTTMIYLWIGVLQFLTLIFAFSRGGILSAIMMMPFILLATWLFAKHERLKIVTFLIIIAGVLLFVFETYLAPLPDIVYRVQGRIQISEGEVRALLYKEAWHNFKQYPIFGTGLGHDIIYFQGKPMSMYWYHSTLFQIIGSLGIVGLLAYGYQMVVRGLVLIRVKSIFNVFVALSVAGFAAYSMVNVGYFVPLPFVAMLVMMFLVVERYNETLNHHPHLFDTEQIWFLQR